MIARNMQILRPFYFHRVEPYLWFNMASSVLMLDNTGANGWTIGVNPSLLGNQISENLELYIK